MTKAILVAVAIASCTTQAFAVSDDLAKVDAQIREAREHLILADFAKAESLYQALVARIQHDDPAGAREAAALCDLGTVLQYTGRYAQAEPLYRRALEITLRVPDGPDASAVRNNMATLYRRMGRVADAERMHRENLRDRERRFGPDAPLTAVTLNNLAEVLRGRAQFDEAMKYAGRAVNILSTHPASTRERLDLADALHTQAAVHMDQGDWQAARPLYERALALRQELLGPDHPRVALTLVGLATTEIARTRIVEAEPLLTRAIGIFDRTANSVPEAATAYNNLAQVYKITQRYAEAEPMFRRALAIWERTPGRTSTEYALGLSNLADLLVMEGRVLGADALYRRAIEIVQVECGADDPRLRELRARLESLEAGAARSQGTVDVRDLCRGDKCKTAFGRGSQN